MEIFNEVAQIIVDGRIPIAASEISEKKSLYGLQMYERESVRIAYKNASAASAASEGASPRKPGGHMTIHIYYHPTQHKADSVLIEVWYFSLQSQPKILKKHLSLFYRSLYTQLRLLPIARQQKKSVSQVQLSYKIIKDAPRAHLDGATETLRVFDVQQQVGNLHLAVEYIRDLDARIALARSVRAPTPQGIEQEESGGSRHPSFHGRSAAISTGMDAAARERVSTWGGTSDADAAKLMSARDRARASFKQQQQQSFDGPASFSRHDIAGTASPCSAPINIPMGTRPGRGAASTEWATSAPNPFPAHMSFTSHSLKSDISHSSQGNLSDGSHSSLGTGAYNPHMMAGKSLSGSGLGTTGRVSMGEEQLRLVEEPGSPRMNRYGSSLVSRRPLDLQQQQQQQQQQQHSMLNIDFGTTPPWHVGSPQVGSLKTTHFIQPSAPERTFNASPEFRSGAHSPSLSDSIQGGTLRDIYGGAPPHVDQRDDELPFAMEFGADEGLGSYLEQFKKPPVLSMFSSRRGDMTQSLMGLDVELDSVRHEMDVLERSLARPHQP